MIYGSVCSGVEAATVAWHPLGWKPAWFSEIEAFPSAVLKHHYPSVENLGDMTKFKEWPHDKPVDVLVGGTPCQSFSIAGLRKGLADPRGNLMLTYLAIASQYRAKWLVWENVPGVLSSNGGRDFGTFLGALGELGYGFAYRVLDAQYFGVAQRRRRVFVVGYLGDWRRAAAVLFERESLSGDIAPSREAREEIAGTVTTRSGSGGGGGLGTDEACNGFLQPVNTVGPLTAGMHKGPRGTEAVESNHLIAFPAEISGVDLDTKPLVFGAQNSSKQGLSASTKVAPTLDASKTPAVSFGIPGNWIGRKPENGGNSTTPMNNIAPNLTSADKHGVAYDLQVRRLTPKECERLQGFPDDYTRIPWNKKDAKHCPDGPRYKAMGNSMAVPVMRWIGNQIAMVERKIA